MADTSTTPMNHDYDAPTGTLTPKPDAPPTDNSGNMIKPSKFKMPPSADQHKDNDGKWKTPAQIADEAS